MNPFKYIWLFIKFVYHYIKYERSARRLQKSLDKLFSILNTEQDEAIAVKRNSGTMVKDEVIWFNQN